MAITDRMRYGYRSSDELDDYLRNEYRAEEGAYLERRPAYARYGAGDRDTRYWGPRIPTDYYLDEGFARTGTAAPLGEPVHGPGDIPDERLRREQPYDPRPASDYPRRTRADYDRHSRNPRQQDREAGQHLLHAAENFYEKMAESVGMEPHEAEVRHHRGRGPRNYRRSDERILDEVNQRLTDDPYIDASDVEVAVLNQEVTLSGTVNTRFEKRHAEDVVEMIPGITHVQNNLRVKPRSE